MLSVELLKNHGKFVSGSVVELPDAEGQALVDNGFGRIALVPVRFVGAYGIYNSGESAGFGAETAERLVEARLAMYLDKSGDPIVPVIEAPKPKPAKKKPVVIKVDNLEAMHWKQAVEAVKACDSLEQLDAWHEGEERESVLKALVTRAEALTEE